MKLSIKKKTIKIIIGIIVAIVIIVGSIFAFQFISTNIKIKETEEKLSQINAEELQTKLIAELENTRLNINISNGNQFVMTKFEKNNEDFKGFIVASIFLIGENDIDFVGIPCFKIESDNVGKFKSIIYLESGIEIEKIVSNAVEKVFQNDYNINIITDDSNYNGHFRNVEEQQEIIFTNTDFWEIIHQKIVGYTPAKNSKNLFTIKFSI